MHLSSVKELLSFVFILRGLFFMIFVSMPKNAPASIPKVHVKVVVKSYSACNI